MAKKPNIKRKISKRNRTVYSSRSIKYIVVHYVGAVSTAANNASYFYSTYRGASAHYFTDDISIWQVVEDKNAAWHCGGGRQGNGGGSFLGKCTNSNSIGVEMCCKKKNGSLYITDKTIEKTAEIVRYLMDKYDIPASRVIRHYDVTGKNCPAPYINEKKWDKLHKKLTGKKSSGSSTAKEPANDGKTAVDGSWGKDCTRKSQKVFKTTVDGIVSYQPSCNKKYLPNAYAGSWKFCKSDYKAGSELIAVIQTFLKVGYYTGKIDGWCGKKTVKAMQKFLRAKGLYTGEIDGSMGPKTVRAWQKYINSRL